MKRRRKRKRKWRRNCKEGGINDVDEETKEEENGA